MENRKIVIVSGSKLPYIWYEKKTHLNVESIEHSLLHIHENYVFF